MHVVEFNMTDYGPMLTVQDDFLRMFKSLDWRVIFNNTFFGIHKQHHGLPWLKYSSMDCREYNTHNLLIPFPSGIELGYGSVTGGLEENN